jgi:hypothetical protein
VETPNAASHGLIARIKCDGLYVVHAIATGTTPILRALDEKPARATAAAA